MNSNPAEHLEKVIVLRPQAVRTHRWLSEAEVRRILDSFETSVPLTVQDHRDALVLRLGLTAGLRNFEIRTLPLTALANLDKQQITVKGKGGKLADVFVPERTAVLLDSWRDLYEAPKPDAPVVIGFRSLQDWETGERLLVPQWGVGITQQAVGRIVTERTRAAGLQAAPHDLRRAYCGIMEDKVGLVETSRAMRHAQISTTQLYLENRQDSAYQAAKKAGLDM
jgi:site-specific recombinase XerC